jgi:coenzyme F420-0:L-glutamate ligase/coenzyme F420-1:gamma-L-glutamate ligase
VAFPQEASMKLEFLPVPGVPAIKAGDGVGAILAQCARSAAIAIAASDIVAIAQKVVSKAEGRSIRLSDVKPSARAVSLAQQMNKDPRLIETILRETRRVVRCRGDVLICETRHGFICANAGVDRSNVDGGDTVTLLPVDPDRSARRIAEELGCGVIITDTFGRAWREGLVDVAIGIAGVPPFVDYRGASDAYGYPLQASVLAAADALAAAAGMVMGKTTQTPAIIVRGYSAQSGDFSAQALLRSKEKDLFL